MAIKPASPWYFASAAGGFTDATDHQAAAAVTGQRNFLTGLQFSNENATTSSEIVVKDGTNVIWRGFAPKAMVTTENINFDPPLQSTAGNALFITMVTTGGATAVSAQGFTDP